MEGGGVLTPASRHVLLALTGGAAIMLVAGGRIDTLRAKMLGQPPPEPQPFEPGTLAGWATLLVVLVFAADIGPLGPLAVGFAWLIFFVIAMMFGPEAASNISGLMGGSKASSPAATTPSEQAGVRPV